MVSILHLVAFWEIISNSFCEYALKSPKFSLTIFVKSLTPSFPLSFVGLTSQPTLICGIAFLSLPDDVMYLYLPAFHKIRQIASHVKNQNFAGTDFTYDDLSAFRMAEKHTAVMISQDGKYYVVKLLPKKNARKEWL